MNEVMLVDDRTMNCSSYQNDLQLIDSVLSATGFDSVNFTPVNPISLPISRRRKVTYQVPVEMQTRQLRCDICNRTFPLKKTRDRHRESVHKQQMFPCSTCHRTFTRKDIRSRHQAEKHSGRRRSRVVAPIVSSDTKARVIAANEPYDVICIDDDISTSDASLEVETTILLPEDMDSHPALDNMDLDLDDLYDRLQGQHIHDCIFPLGLIGLRPAHNPLLLCTNLLMRSNVYRRFYIDDRRRELVSQEKWEVPCPQFQELYKLAWQTLAEQLATSTKNFELLAAMVVLVNVDVIIGGTMMIGHHSRAISSMKAHHRSQRGSIFEALNGAFEHCGDVFQSMRIIYTKHGFVWMLNMGYRCLTIPID